LQIGSPHKEKYIEETFGFQLGFDNCYFIHNRGSKEEIIKDKA